MTTDLTLYAFDDGGKRATMGVVTIVGLAPDASDLHEWLDSKGYIECPECLSMVHPESWPRDSDTCDRCDYARAIALFDEEIV